MAAKNRVSVGIHKNKHDEEMAALPSEKKGRKEKVIRAEEPGQGLNYLYCTYPVPCYLLQGWSKTKVDLSERAATTITIVTIPGAGAGGVCTAGSGGCIFPAPPITKTKIFSSRRL